MHLDQLSGSFFGPSNLVDLLEHRAEHQANSVGFRFLIDGEEQSVQLTYSELEQKAKAVAALLQSMGMTGERALLLYPAGLDFVAAFFGCLYAGVVAVPAYPPRRNRNMVRVESIARDAQPKIALTTPAVLEQMRAMINGDSVLSDVQWLSAVDVDADLASAWQRPEVHGETLAVLQYTSGSTGIPKGVMLNHANLLHNSAMINYAFEYTRSGHGVFWLPLYHDMGLIGGILQPLYLGGPNTLLSPAAFLQKPVRWLQAISRSQATISGGPNFAYDICVEKITAEQKKSLDLSSWTIAFNGAEPVRAATLERFSNAFAECGFRREAFYPCYGLAEATLIVSGGLKGASPVVRYFDTEALEQHEVVEALPDEDTARELVGCGGNLLDQQIVIVEPETCQRCPSGRVGEIWVSGPSRAVGYWKRPEETAHTFGGRLADDDAGPFLRTGDLGFLLDGELFITGRLKDLIIIRGVNHYPQDVEFTVQESDSGLRTAAGAAFTIGEEGHEKLVVVHEVERQRDLDYRQIIENIQHAIAIEHELSVHAIVLLRAGSIPKTSSGKIQRYGCRVGYLDGSLKAIARWSSEEGFRLETALRGRGDRHAHHTAGGTSSNGQQADLSQPESDRASASAPADSLTAQIIYDVVRSIARERAKDLTPDTNIVELGLDSLERMEVVTSLEARFGGQFPLDVMQQMQTCGEVMAAVKEHLGDPTELEMARRQATSQHPHTGTTLLDGRPAPLHDNGRPAAPQMPLQFKVAHFPEYQQLKETMARVASFGLDNPYFNVHEGVTNDRTTIDGREFVNFCSYNYLGMSGDPTVTEAAREAARIYGTSVSASRLVSGEKPIHRELEQAIAEFIGVADSVVFVGGHSTNESVIGHLVGPGDLILHDGLAHNSIIQGALLSGARRRSFPHNDFAECGQFLEAHRHEYRRVLLVIEGVYSMDGDYPDLCRFIDVKKRHKAMLMVDEAHSMGTMGLHGRGISEHFEIDPRDVDVWMGTLSKSFGSCGGYIAGDKDLVEFIKYTAPGFVYSVGLSPPNAAAALASIRLLEGEPERVAQLNHNSQLFLKLARQAGLDTGRCMGTAVVPVIVGSSRGALALSHRLYERGINVQPILYPAVEEHAARLRFFITSTHTEEQIRETVSATAEEIARINATPQPAKKLLAAHQASPAN